MIRGCVLKDGAETLQRVKGTIKTIQSSKVEFKKMGQRFKFSCQVYLSTI